MQLTFKENLPNLANGIINKVSLEIDYETNENSNNIWISGKFIVIREIKYESRITEIKNHIPVEIDIAKGNLIQKTKEVFLRLDGFYFEFKNDVTVISGELELGNVEEPQSIVEELQIAYRKQQNHQ